VGIDEVKINLNKIKLILKWPILIIIKGVKAFLKVCNYYRQYIEGYTKKITILTNIIKKNKLFI